MHSCLDPLQGIAQRRSSIELVERQQGQADRGTNKKHDGRGGQEPRPPGLIAEILGHHGAGAYLRRRRRGNDCVAIARQHAGSLDGCQTLFIDAVGHGRQLIHPLPALRIDLHGLAQNHGEDLVARCDFGQVYFRFEADLFEVRHAVTRQRVVQIFGNRVAVQVRRSLRERRGAQPQASHHVANLVEQLCGKLAVLDLLADFLGIFGIQQAVHVGQEGSQRQSHDNAPRGRCRAGLSPPLPRLVASERGFRTKSGVEGQNSAKKDGA